jgi:hypothetical protein
MLSHDTWKEAGSGKHEHLCMLYDDALAKCRSSHIIEIIKRNHIDVIRPAGVVLPRGLIFITDSNSLSM